MFLMPPKIDNTVSDETSIAKNREGLDEAADRYSAQQMELERKAVALENTLERINGLKEGLEERIRLAVQKNRYLLSLDNYFDELIKMNTKYDKHAMEVIKTASSYGIPKNEIAESYKDLLDELSDQNKIFNELYKHFGYISKKATKCQKHINRLMEKYMNEISRLSSEAN